jgi:hypothetical protein
MKRLVVVCRRASFAAAVLLFAWGGAVLGGNVGPMMIQNYGADIDNASQFRTNIGAQAALGFTPLNKAGDAATGLIGFTSTATASAAGTTQGTATAITAQTTIFTVVAAGAGAVLNPTIGVPYTIINTGANVLSVYPFTGAAIGSNSVNAAAGVAVNGQATFRCVTATQCYAGL